MLGITSKKISDLIIKVVNYKYDLLYTTNDGYAVYDKNILSEEGFLYVNKTIYMTVKTYKKIYDIIETIIIGRQYTDETMNNINTAIYQIIADGFDIGTVSFDEEYIRYEDDEKQLVTMPASEDIYFKKPDRVDRYFDQSKKVYAIAVWFKIKETPNTDFQNKAP